MKDKCKALFAVDFSSGSKAALMLLKLLKKSYAIDLELIHVIPSFWKDWFTSGKYQEEALQRLQSYQLELTKVEDTDKLHVDHGNSADIILQKANSINSNLIILGSKGAGNSGQYKTGNVAEDVAHHATMPVWICKNESLSKILCGIDGSPSSEKALQFAIDLSRHFSASLHIISALHHADFNPLGMEENEIAEHEKKFKEEQVNSINQFLEGFDFSNISVKKSFPFGSPGDIILDMAEDLNYELIVVGAKGHSMLHHILIGSTAKKILRYAPCSLLVVR